MIGLTNRKNCLTFGGEYSPGYGCRITFSLLSPLRNRGFFKAFFVQPVANFRDTRHDTRPSWDRLVIPYWLGLQVVAICNINPAQYERNGRFRHLVYACLADKPMVRRYHLRDYYWTPLNQNPVQKIATIYRQHLDVGRRRYTRRRPISARRGGKANVQH